MIYLVTKNSELFEATEYKIIGVDESLSLLSKESILQVDSETMGRNAHICSLLSFQFGSINKEWQIVIDCTTIDIKLYKHILEEKLLIGHNLKFDLQFLYNYNIIPRRVYDTMIVEQLLYLGYMYIPISPKEYEFFNYTFPYLVEDNPKKKSYGKYTLSYSLKAVAYKYLKVDLDKTIRGEIIWRGLTASTIVYAAHDTLYLYDIMVLQIKECKAKNCIEGMKLECNVVPAMAYLEWCGIMLDEDKWKTKMASDTKLLGESKQALDNFVTSNPDLSEFTYIERQGDLFSGFSLDPICTINWSSSAQVAKLAKKLGFDTVVKDKKTGQDKDSVLEKHLKPQVGINDEFLKLYFDYQEHSKVVSSFGQGHLNAVNPITGRIHTTYYQLGTKSGRMSSGNSKQGDTDLEKYKKLPQGSCKYLNMQQLPSDKVTRSCFVAQKGNLFCSCDYSAQEGRVQAEIYNEPVLIDMYHRGLDSHSVNAKIFFKDELADVDVTEVKEKRPDLRKAAKSPFFALSYGGTYKTLMTSLRIDKDKAKSIVENYEKGYQATMEYAQQGLEFVKTYGYIVINETFGHRLYWWDFPKWEYIKNYGKCNFDIAEDEDDEDEGLDYGETNEESISIYNKKLSSYGRLARNSPPQGTSSIMTKIAMKNLFNWIVDNNYFGIIRIVNVTHDEINSEFPESLKDTYPHLVQQIMGDAGKSICSKVDVPAEAEVDTCWRH